jgi:hypothetical protein
VANYHDFAGISPDFDLYAEGYSSNDLLLSEGHPWPRMRGTGGDIGGEFWVVKRDYESSGSDKDYEVYSGGQYWKGRQFAHAYN